MTSKSAAKSKKSPSISRSFTIRLGNWKVDPSSFEIEFKGVWAWRDVAHALKLIPHEFRTTYTQNVLRKLTPEEIEQGYAEFKG